MSNQLAAPAIDKFYQQCNTMHSQLWAIRDKNAAYIACSDSYAKLFGLNKIQVVSIDNLMVDEQTKESIRLKDHQVLESAKTQTIAEAFMLKDQLYLAEISRYPLENKRNSISAIGIIIAPLLAKGEVIKHNLDDTKHKLKLSYRDLLIGLLLIHRWKGAQIAEHLSISQTRLTQIIGRICRSYFMVAGGGAVYRKLLIESGMYKQIPIELLKQYSTEAQKRWEQQYKQG